MEYENLKDSGIKISKMALGCWTFGGKNYLGEAGAANARDAMNTVDAALDAGINLFDTAESYNDGQSDLFLGRAMRGRREKFIVSSKVYLDKLAAKVITQVCEECLKRLGTDYIDIFSPHYASREIPFSETFGALEKLKQKGMIRAIGISNFGVQSLAMLEEISMMDQVVLHQLPYSLLWRAIEYGIQQKTMQNGIGIICYSPLARGLLSGRYKNDVGLPDKLKVLRLFDSRETGAPHGEKGCKDEVFAAIGRLKRLCADAGVDMVTACVAWLYYQSGVQSVLTGGRTPAQFAENLKATKMELSKDLVSEMSAATDDVKRCLGGNADMWFSGTDSRIF